MAAKRDTSAARSRLQQEAERIARMKADAARPEGCGSEIVDVAPGRGAVRRFQPRAVVRGASGQLRVRRDGHNGHDALARADAFDVMQQKARGRGGKDAAPLFTVGQVNVGREYAALYERCAAAGVRCSSLEALGGGGGQGSYSEAVSFDLARLAELNHLVGAAVVLSPRRSQANADPAGKIVRASNLVHGVCVQGLTIGQLLQKFGWRPKTTRVKETRRALCDALDRMQGYRD
jgi:hypothetical protein